LSLEYSILGLTGLSNYRPEPWSPVSVLAWAKAMAYNLQANLDEEIERAVLLAVLDRGDIDSRVAAVGDHGQRVVGLAVGAPHLPG